MKISLNTIKQYTDIDLSVDELVVKINAQLGGVEAVVNLGERYKDAVIVKVVECEKHSDADKLSVCKIDAGTGELVQVVCGAPNVRAGMFAVWLPPTSVVPSSYDEKELFTLEARELRGVVSNGMLASAKELALGDSHEGILEINPNEWKPNDTEIKAGTSFAKAYGLDDTIIDIENKMFTHRPDLFGQLGVAREIAGIQHKKFTSPDWYAKELTFESASGLDLQVKNEAQEAVPRFMAVAIKGVEIKPSPVWLQAELMRLGGKPINNVVDVTNYIMLLTAQPTHAYDYDKLRGHTLVSRLAKKGETAKLLNGKTYEFDEADIIIADGEGPVGLAGIMGATESEVSSETKNIVLEVANFDMYTVRRSSMRHGIFTDALTRFNKGQSPLQNPNILSLLMMSIHDVAGGEQASGVFDEHAPNFDEKSYEPISLDEKFISARLGVELSRGEIQKLLENVEMKVFTETDITITKPFWRTDLELPEDIVEEVGRLYGYGKLPRELPKRSTKPTPKNVSRELAKAVRETLARAGANEVLTYSFVHQNVLKNAGQDSAHAYRLSNALSPDLQYYRLSLTPSLLDKVHMNIKAGHDKFAIFEINKVHYKGEMDESEPDVPNEDKHVALTIASKQKSEGSAYFVARKYLEQILDLRSIEIVLLSDFDTSKDEWGHQLTAAFEPNRSAVIVKDQQIWGVVGEYNQSVKRAFKLPDFSAGFEIHEGVLLQPEPAYKPLSKYPSTTRDISLEVDNAKTYGEVLSVIEKQVSGEQGSDIQTFVTPVTIYQADGTDKKTFTFRIKFTPSDKTLVGDEVSRIMDTAAGKIVTELDAKIV